MWLKIIVLLLAFTTHQSIGSRTKITAKEYVSMPILFHMDDYDRCLLYGDDFQYCAITFQLHPKDPSNKTQIWNIIETISADSSYYRHDQLRHGVCIPETCPQIKALTSSDPTFKGNFSECYSKKFVDYGVEGEIVKMVCETNEPLYPIYNNDVIFAVVMGVYIAFVIFASLYEGIARYKSKEEYEKVTETPVGRFISAFAVAKNWYRLKTVDFENKDVQDLSCIQGIRFYNMALVIFTHTVMLNFAAPVTNPHFTESMTEKFLTVFLGNGGFAVQTFFMISAWLMTYSFFKSFEGKKNISIKYLVFAFIHRYIRLVPTMAVIIAFNATWLPRIGHGPFWDEFVGTEFRRCKENGWSNLFYLNNYVNRTEMCMAQTWYMAVDTQFFVLGLIILYIIWHNPKRITAICGSVMAFHTAVLGGIVYWNNWEAAIRPEPEDMYAFKVVDIEQWHIVMGSNYAHLPGLAVGIMFGYFFYKNRNTKMFTKKSHVVLWWILVWGMSLGIILIPGWIMFSTNYEHNRLIAALYAGLGRTIFVIGIGITIFGMSKGIGWMMKWTCEWYPTYVLGRLTYSAYLVHVSIMKIRGGSKRTPTYLSDEIIIGELLGDLGSSYIAALILTLLFELPITALQKNLTSPKEKKELKETNGVKLNNKKVS